MNNISLNQFAIRSTNLFGKVFQIILFVCFFSYSYGQVSYEVKVKTKDCSGCGTDNFVYIKLFGVTGTSPEFELKGDMERTNEDVTTYNTVTDLGMINRVQFHMTTYLLDCWTPEWLIVTRRVNNIVSGVSSFQIDKEICKGEQPEFTGTYNEEYNTTGTVYTEQKKVSFVDKLENNSSMPNKGANVSSTISNSIYIGVSSTQSSTQKKEGVFELSFAGSKGGASGGLKVGGGMSVENLVSTTIDRQQSEVKSITEDYSFDAAPNSFTIRKLTYSIPYQYVEYKSNVSSQYFYFRTFNGAVPRPQASIISIPLLPNVQNFTPIRWSALMADWVPFGDEELRSGLESHKSEWVRNGYVMDDGGNPIDKNISEAPSYFDAQFYLETNPDLKAAFGNDYKAALNHWLTTGLPVEGRRCSPDFDVKYYLATYPDLKNVFGTDYKAALNHWLTTGLPTEGRRGSREFDVKFYLSNYTDLKTAFGTDYRGALNHWLKIGLPNEGRQGSREFDAQFYLSNYADLKTAFGTSYSAALVHWVNHGIPEGRKGIK